MKLFSTQPLRATARLLWLGGELAAAMGARLFRRGHAGHKSQRAARAHWLHALCRRLVPVFSVTLETSGAIPQRGLLVSNHLSYLDIIVLSATTPVVFVSKSEVANWPVIGWFARLAGTLFVRRDQRADVARLGEDIRAILAEDVLVVLFPEGTSSGGETVLPFRSSLLEPAVGSDRPLTAACIEYALADGDAAEEVCYWKDMTLAPHLFNLLAKQEVKASLRMAEVPGAGLDRKALARELHAEVARLKVGEKESEEPSVKRQLALW